MTTISAIDCAKMIRGVLKQGFPLTKFSVRYKSYSGGHSIDVSWTDGPTVSQVNPIIRRYESKGFDGMTDSSYYCGSRVLAGQRVEVNGGYVRGSRRNSPELRLRIIDRLAYECGLGPVKVNEYGGISNDLHVPFNWHPHWHRDAEFNEIPLTINDLESSKPILCDDSSGGEWLSQLVNRIEHSLSLEEQKPISPELLPEYIAYIVEEVAQ